jgi:hypothetical protein
MKSLVVFSRDPGATQHLIAMIEALTRNAEADEPQGLAAFRAEAAPFVGNPRIFARPPGEAMWRAQGFDPQPWAGRDDDAAARLLSDAQAGLLLTGTSDVDEPGDRALWRAARHAKIPSHAVLDQRINLAVRFANPDGTSTFPDRAYVTDDGYAEALAEAGVPRGRIRVSGDLHIARLAGRLSQLLASQVAALRDEWAVVPGRDVILFVSECGREMAGAGRAAPYDELTELDDFLAALESKGHPVTSAPAEDLCVVVRPHPRDARGKYDRYAGRRDSGLQVVVSEAGEPTAALAAADLIVGMNSSLLHEAKALHRPILSLTGHPIGDETGATR